MELVRMNDLSEFETSLSRLDNVSYDLLSLDEFIAKYLSKYRDVVGSYLQTYLKVPLYMFTQSGLLSHISTLLRDEHMKMYQTSDVSVCKVKDEIVSVTPEVRSPSSMIDKVRHILELMTNSSKVSYVESVIGAAGDIQILFTKVGFESLGGIVYLLRPDTQSVSVRKYVKIPDTKTIIYLPSRFYNKSSGRYDRYTDSYLLSVDTLVQRVLEDYESSDQLFDLVKLSNLSCTLSLEEVNSVVGTLPKSADLIKRLYQDYQSDYEWNEDNFSDYLWRCTNIKTNVLELLRSLDEEYTDLDKSSVEFRTILGTLLASRLIQDRLYRSK